MKKELKWGILLMILCTFFTAAGQLFFKYGSQSFEWNLALTTNYNFILGLFLYGIGAVLLVVALKFGDLSVIYPFVSLTFIWVMLISIWFLGEYITNFKIGAVIFIIFGVILIAKGS